MLPVCKTFSALNQFDRDSYREDSIQFRLSCIIMPCCLQKPRPVRSDARKLKPHFRPTQLHICFAVENSGNTPFEFQAAAIADFAVEDLSQHAASVRLVGLGMQHAIDMSAPAKPRVVFNADPFTYPFPEPGVLRWVPHLARCLADIVRSCAWVLHGLPGPVTI
jgi:hypothetical protein